MFRLNALDALVILRAKVKQGAKKVGSLIGVVTVLAHLCSSMQRVNLPTRGEHLTTTFKQNGYPLPFIHTISSCIQEPSTPPEEESVEEPDDKRSQDETKLPLVIIP